MSNQYYKRNYVDVLQIITPSYYKGEDGQLADKTNDIVYDILKTEIDLIEQNLYIGLISSEPVSSLLGHNPSVGYASGLVPYFVKQNRKSLVTLEEFDLNIISPLGYSLEDYGSPSSFKNFLSATLLPSIRLAQAEEAFA